MTVIPTGADVSDDEIRALRAELIAEAIAEGFSPEMAACTDDVSLCDTALRAPGSDRPRVRALAREGVAFIIGKRSL